MSGPAENLTPQAREFLLAFADDEHLMGQRHAEWIGVAPFLEEDLALASIGQDELGHAADLYGILVGDEDEAVDRLAFRRPVEEYRSCWLVEYETNDWAETMVRHWYYDTAEELRWPLLVGSSVAEAAALVERARREESYHRIHADGLLDVLLSVDESRRRIEYAATNIYPLAAAQFDPVAGEVALVADGVITGIWSEQLEPWKAMVGARFPSIDLAALDEVPVSPASVRAEQENRTRRHRHFEVVYDRIREVMKYDPEAVW